MYNRYLSIHWGITFKDNPLFKHSKIIDDTLIGKGHGVSPYLPELWGLIKCSYYKYKG